ncbi:MAG: DUF309 domain-containing protein [Phycisphaeraceae bacterium]
MPMHPPRDTPPRVDVDPDAPTPVRQAGLHFNHQRFFDAHEGWEEHWHDMQGPAREAMQALIQIAVALEHDQRGNATGARRTLQRATTRLLAAGQSAQNLFGIDVADLMRQAQQWIDRHNAR